MVPKRMAVACLAVFATCFIHAAERVEVDLRQLAKAARAEYAKPVRPGVPGKRPFWNKYSRRFMYAPAFDFKPLGGAAKYRFTVVHEATKRVWRFEADRPWAALSWVWLDVPVGYVTVTVEALDGTGRAFATVGQRRFWRAAMWDGLMPQAVRSYAESARLGLRFLFREKHVQNWLKTGKPDPGYTLYCYPSKIMGAVIQGMVLYAKMAPADEAKRAVEIARRVADFLISISYGEDTAYPYFPPTYLGDKAAAKRYAGQIMIFYPTRPANAYLDLYDVTGEKKYFQAALRIADTYVKTQLPEGSWPLKVMAKTGKPVVPNICVPIEMVMLFDRLIGQYRQGRYKAARDKAWRWILENPMKTYNWQAQFEDVHPAPPYKNLARDLPCTVAGYIFRRYKSDPDLVAAAEEMVRFAEDQFVVWREPMPQPRRKVEAWHLPGVLEQYYYYVPIDASAAQMIIAWHDAYRATGKPLYLAKMRAMANQMTRVQYQDTGQFPTYWWDRPRGYWFNCAVWDAVALLHVIELSPK